MGHFHPSTIWSFIGQQYWDYDHGMMTSVMKPWLIGKVLQKRDSIRSIRRRNSKRDSSGTHRDSVSHRDSTYTVAKRDSILVSKKNMINFCAIDLKKKIPI